MDLSRRSLLKLIGVTPLAIRIPRPDIQEPIQQEKVAQEMLHTMYKSHIGYPTAYVPEYCDLYFPGVK